ncbi:MAG TPA: hypothetical protein VNT52_03565 [Acidimicrobiales bacterium]|jgi:hypothetical protein|nr:hypothetical protein [Acidimicrobiales bacterium]
MPKPKVSTLGKNIQVLGHFNPRLFVPQWFADVGLLASEEVGDVKNEIIHEEIAQFALDWVSIRVTKDRLAASTTRVGHIEPLRDLVAGTLDLLTHTPTMSLGINHDYWFDFTDRDSFDAFGWTLVAPSNWPLMDRPGMAQLTVQGKRTDEREGYVRVLIDPQLDGGYRVNVGVNDHYQVDSTPAARCTPMIVEIINARWFDSIADSQALIDDLARLASE